MDFIIWRERHHEEGRQARLASMINMKEYTATEWLSQRRLRPTLIGGSVLYVEIES